ncbi:MAG: ion transporter [Schleiferiaceae bacterium]|nr:ion transporter [Schleiferiaceae bacterium]
MRLFLNQKFVFALIVLNIIVIFINGYDIDSQSAKWLLYFDDVITLAFLVEMLVKLNFLGSKKYFGSRWNLFDFVLVLISIPSLFYYLLPFFHFDLSFLLVFRVLRVFKFFRFFRFVPQIDKIIIGVQKALKASVIILFAFLVFNLTLGILSNYLFRSLSPEHFGDPLLSIYSIFKIFTIEGWYEIPESIIETVESKLLSFAVKSYFIFILLGGGVFGLSLVNSIFVDAMISESNDDISKDVNEIKVKLDLLLKQQQNN